MAYMGNTVRAHHNAVIVAKSRHTGTFFEPVWKQSRLIYTINKKNGTVSCTVFHASVRIVPTGIAA